MQYTWMSAAFLALGLSACGGESFENQVDGHVKTWAAGQGCAQVENFKRTDLKKGTVGKSLEGEQFRNRFEAVVSEYAYTCVKADGAKTEETAATLTFQNASTAQNFGKTVAGADKNQIEDLKVTTDFQ